MFRITSSLPTDQAAPPSSALKKKRRPAGTPDPDAEVVSLSPRTLLESERYVCDICRQAFQREQNLQMHRRRHKVPWKSMLKRPAAAAGAAAGDISGAGRKRVFVCPDPACLHHNPCHALGDLVGIKKHFRRKHSANRQWACARCSKAYAVHSDYKAHLKTCGTRGHSCDCGRVFSRVETFIEHQDSCTSNKTQPPPTSSPNHTIELSLLPPSSISADLHLSIAPPHSPPRASTTAKPAPSHSPSRATATAKAADSAREEAMQQVQMAERELAAARRIRQQAKAELEKACALRAAAARQINSILLQITCGDCRQRTVRRPLPLPQGDAFAGGDDEGSGLKSFRL